LRYQCSPYHRDSVLHPFVVALGRAARLAPEDLAETQLDKLEAILAPERIAETAPLFASLLSIPAGGRYPALALSAAQQRRLTLAALLDQLEALAREKPVLMLFEDVHWADATSLEVLDLTPRGTRSMSAVRNWLEEIGLAQYADAFEANDIDTDLLTQIDDQY
jgi:predicted ATPase